MTTTIQFEQQDIQPNKIICVGRNYVAHAKELGNEAPTEPVIFLKPASAISNQLVAERDLPIHFETELCLLMGKSEAKNSGVIGLGIGMDLTKRDRQNSLKEAGLPWERSKAFDGSAVFTKFVDVPEDLDWNALSYTLTVDGEMIQHGEVPLMIFSPEEVITDLQKDIPARAGDIIMTGTPAGVGPLKKGSDYQVSLKHNDELLLEHSWQAE